MSRPDNEHNDSKKAFSGELTPQKNKEKVFFDIVNRYKSKVYYMVRNIVVSHEDADDAAQNTFIKVWENLDQFRNESALYTWIYRIATNEALNILRKRKPNLSLDDLGEAFFNEHSTETLWMDANETEIQLQIAINSLPVKQKLVFCLRYFEDLSYQQISSITETSEGALKASYFHAVKKIEEFLKHSI